VVCVALTSCFGGDDDDPKKSAGAPCTRSEECSASLACLGPAGGLTCRVPGRTGDPCWSDSSAGCAAGFVCSASTCIEPGTRTITQKCSYNVDCEDGLICNWGSDPYRCTEPQMGGDPCGDDTDCADGFYCPGGTEPTAGSCTCVQCKAGLVCSAEGCITPHTKAENERCWHNVDCETGLICLWVARPYLCRPPLQAGEHCGDPSDCAASLTCFDGICR
jgi:hypothetical protein